MDSREIAMKGIKSVYYLLVLFGIYSFNRSIGFILIPEPNVLTNQFDKYPGFEMVLSIGSIIVLAIFLMRLTIDARENTQKDKDNH